MLANFVDNFDPFIFRLWDNVGPRWYGFAYVLAFISAYFVVRLLSKRGYCDLPPERVSDFITWTALFGVLLGGRIGYVLFYKPEMLREPLSILRVWEGGMASHGGMIGILALTFYYARRHKLTWTNLGDALVVAAPIGLRNDWHPCTHFLLRAPAQTYLDKPGGRTRGRCADRFVFRALRELH